MSQQVLEGTWKEIAHDSDELDGKRVRLTALEDEPIPNEAMLTELRDVDEIQKGMRLISGEDTQLLVREAREGRDVWSRLQRD